MFSFFGFFVVLGDIRGFFSIFRIFRNIVWNCWWGVGVFIKGRLGSGGEFFWLIVRWSVRDL